MNPEIFREYDIRGIAGKDMTEDDVLIIGKAVGTYLKQRGHTQLNVGRDCRTTSDSYSEKIIEGLLSTGCDVVISVYARHRFFTFQLNTLKGKAGS